MCTCVRQEVRLCICLHVHVHVQVHTCTCACVHAYTYVRVPGSRGSSVSSTPRSGRAREAAERSGLEFEVLIRGEPLYVDPQSSYVREVLTLAEKDKPRTVAYGTDGSVFPTMKKLVVIGPEAPLQAG